MIETVQPVMAAGRCVIVVRPHRWTRWNVVELELSPVPMFRAQGGRAVRQRRECLRCGRTQVAGLQ